MKVAATTALALTVLALAARGNGATQPMLLLEGTVVTMDAAHHVLPQGRVLVRDGVIVAVWSGTPPAGISTASARVVSAGRGGLLFPGLIDLHDHPSHDVLPLWLPPRSYDNRYQWSLTSPPTFVRLVQRPHALLAARGLQRDVLVHAEAHAALAGETAIEGVGSQGSRPSSSGRSKGRTSAAPTSRPGCRVSATSLLSSGNTRLPAVMPRLPQVRRRFLIDR